MIAGRDQRAVGGNAAVGEGGGACACREIGVEHLHGVEDLSQQGGFGAGEPDDLFVAVTGMPVLVAVVGVLAAITSRTRPRGERLPAMVHVELGLKVLLSVFHGYVEHTGA